MYIKIYFNDKPLFLCDNIDKTIEPFVHHDDAVFIDELDTHTIKTILHEMQQPEVHAGVFFHEDLDKLKNALFKKFTIVQAAGGLVTNQQEEILMIFRRGSWDLPKGKVGPGEELQDCAIREVEEETGLKNVELISPLIITWHTYHQGSRFILKESHWYKMKADGQQKLIPQTEEDIHDIKWVNNTELDSLLKKAFPLIADVLQAGLSK